MATDPERIERARALRDADGRELDLLIARGDERLKMRLSPHEDEDTAVIEQRAQESVRAKSDPPPRTVWEMLNPIAIIRTLDKKQRLIPVVIVVGGATFGVLRYLKLI